MAQVELPDALLTNPTEGVQHLRVDGSGATQPVSGSVDLGTWLGSAAPTVGQKTMAASVPVTIASDQAVIPVTAVTSTVVSSAATVQLLAANVARRGAAVYNDSTKTMYLKLGTTASTTNYTVQVSAGAYYEVPFGYTGRIDGIWSGANGNARLTELT